MNRPEVGQVWAWERYASYSKPARKDLYLVVSVDQDDDDEGFVYTLADLETGKMCTDYFYGHCWSRVA